MSEDKSEFEKLIELDFPISEDKFKRLLKLIMNESGKDRLGYLLITLLKIQVEIYKELKKP